MASGANLFKNKYITWYLSGTDCFRNIFNRINNQCENEIIVPVTLCYSVIKEIKKAGLIPIFVDVTEDFQLDLDKIINSISKKTLAIIFVNQYGYVPIRTNLSFYNLNNKKIINILDKAQSYFESYDPKYDYTIYSCNKNKPMEVPGGMGFVISKKKLHSSIELSNVQQKNIEKIFRNKKQIYNKKQGIVDFIKNNLQISGEFIKLTNNSYYRLVFKLNNYNKIIFGKFENMLYEFQKKLGIEIVQTTIDIAAFQERIIKQYLKKHNYSVLKQIDFSVYDKLASTTLYFKIDPKIKLKNYKRVIEFINTIPLIKYNSSVFHYLE